MCFRFYFNEIKIFYHLVLKHLPLSLALDYLNMLEMMLLILVAYA